MAGEARFTPSEADYYGARRDGARRFFRSRTGVLLLLLALALSVSVQVFDGRLAWDADLFADSLVGLIVGGAALALGFLIMPLTLRLTSKRLFRQQKTLHRQFSARWSAEGFGWTSSNGANHVAWPDFHGWYRGRRCFLLYANARMMLFLPLRVLSPEQVADLTATAAGSGARRL